MSRKDKVAQKAVVKERDVKWVPATKSAIKPAKKRRKAG